MCLIVFAYRSHPRYRLIAAANRDEFYARPSQTMHYWNTTPPVLAGKDLQAGGAWMGVSKNRFAALTNFRDPASNQPAAPSRGRLAIDCLQASDPPERYVKRLIDTADRYNGFSLLCGDERTLWYYSNRGGAPEEVPSGIHALSNRFLNTPWPKVVRAKRLLTRLLNASEPVDSEKLFSLLSDRTRPPDADLPDTGVGLELERLLAPIFIAGDAYGARCSTVMLWGYDGRIEVAERTWIPATGQEQATLRFSM